MTETDWEAWFKNRRVKIGLFCTSYMRFSGWYEDDEVEAEEFYQAIKARLLAETKQSHDWGKWCRDQVTETKPQETNDE